MDIHYLVNSMVDYVGKTQGSQLVIKADVDRGSLGGLDVHVTSITVTQKPKSYAERMAEYDQQRERAGR